MENKQMDKRMKDEVGREQNYLVVLPSGDGTKQAIKVVSPEGEKIKQYRKIPKRKSPIRSNHTMNAHNALDYLWKQAVEKARSSLDGCRPFSFRLIPHPRLLASF